MFPHSLTGTSDNKTPTDSLLLPNPETNQLATDSVTQESVTSGQPTNQRFGPRDLTALLKSLEKEIDAYEVLLAEEIEKRKKYRVLRISVV